MKIILSSILLIAVLFFPIQNVNGHGWGLDTTTIDYDEREISITVEIPQYFDNSEEMTIKINAFDKKEKDNIKNVTFLIGLFHEDEMIFRNYFFTPDGDLFIDVIPDSTEEIKISGEQDDLLGAWYATESKPIEISGPIFQSGGLFNVEIEIRTIDEPTNIVEDLGKYSADVSMAETTTFQKPDSEGNQIDFRMKSYFDKITDFDYDAENKIITFKMPFDWSENIVSHIPVVHEEVHFPKNFVELLTPSYVGKINGIELFKSNVIIDDYTEEQERIVHFVLLQDHLTFLKNEQKKNNQILPEFMEFTLEISEKVEFPMNAMTRDEKFQVDLSWDPVDIELGKPTTFVFTIRDGQTGEPLRNSDYNFVILQNNVEIFRTSGTAQVGGDFEEFTFVEEQTGPTIIRFENIRGSGSDTEFGLVVVPEFGTIAILILLIALMPILFFKMKSKSKIFYH